MNIKFFTKKAAVVFVIITITTAFSEYVWAGFQMKEKIEIRPDEPDEPPSEWVLSALYNMLFEGKISMLSVDPPGFQFKGSESNVPVPESVKKEGKCLGTIGQIGNEKDKEQFKKDHKKLLEDNPDKIVTCYFEIKSGYLEAWYTTTAKTEE
ncbi:MAG: hypothetical protein LBL57_05555 [Tannerella sp.]|jgi:hypothetical protein|nr:hypothetical protein [Tannerella sp.]